MTRPTDPTSSACRRHRPRCRRGGAYVAVLGTTMLVSVIGLGALFAARLQYRAALVSTDAAEARVYALSGIEAAKAWMNADPGWRDDYPGTRWNVARPIGGGTFTVVAEDPDDASLTNRAHDRVVVTSTGRKGLAVQVATVTLEANPVPLPILAYAAHTAGQVHVRGSKGIVAKGSTVSAAGTLNNGGTIVGNVRCASAPTVGTIVGGTLTTGAAAAALPGAAVAERYAALGTQINPLSTMDTVLLSPGYNPYGTANAEGVYVIRRDANQVLQNVRVNGTLVIISPGRTVSINGPVFIHPSRKDYPALIVVGNLRFNADASTNLSEAAPLLGYNYNPPGSPYAAAAAQPTDSDTTDWYPNEVQGLVHVTGTVEFNQGGRVRGSIICESAASVDAFDVDALADLVYDASLFTAPPQWYTSAVLFRAKAGTWARSSQ